MSLRYSLSFTCNVFEADIENLRESPQNLICGQESIFTTGFLTSVHIQEYVFFSAWI